MYIEGNAAGCGIYDFAASWEGKARDDDVLIACAAAFSCDYSPVIFGCDFVDDAN